MQHTLEHIATHCNTLQHIVTYCITLQHAPQHTLQHTLQHTPQSRRYASGDVLTLPHTLYTATHGNTLATLTATHFNTVHHTLHTATHCNTLQHTATHCNTHYNILLRVDAARMTCSSRHRGGHPRTPVRPQYSYLYAYIYTHTYKYMYALVNTYTHMRWLRSVGSLKLQVSLAEYCLFYRALL